LSVALESIKSRIFIAGTRHQLKHGLALFQWGTTLTIHDQKQQQSGAEEPREQTQQDDQWEA
jgi:hypothetical protein